MEITCIILGSTQELDQDTTGRGVQDAGVTSVHPWPARSWRGSALDQLWATRAPGWGDGAGSIPTRLLEPASALIVITRPGPISTNHLCNLQSDVELRGRRAQEGEISPTSALSLPSWLCWWFHTLRNHVRDLKMIPGGDDLRTWPSRLGSSVLPSTASVQLWKYGDSFIYCTYCRCSWNTRFGSFRLIVNPKTNI